MGKIIDFNKIKDKKLQKKFIIYFVFLIFLLYIFYSIYLIIKTPNETLIIESGVVNQDETTVGYILRDEIVLEGNNVKNGLTAIISEGERAAKGQTVFRYNGIDEEEIKTKIEEIDLKIQEALSKEPPTKFPADIKNLDKTIDERVYNLNDFTNIHTILEYKKEIEEVINKKAKIAGELSQSGSYIKELTNEKESLEKELTDGSEYITAPVSGVVSYRIDGLEQVLTTKDFSNITEKALTELDIKTGKIISSSKEKGKIIDNFNCYLGAFLNSEAAKKANIGQVVMITFASGKTFQAEVNYISEQDNGKKLIIFKIDNLPEELVEYRKISATITWWSYSGLKIPNSSIVEDKDGLKYVIRRKAGVDKKALIKILKANDKYSIISTYKTEEMKALGVDLENYVKITQYDAILVYPDLDKIKE